MRIRIFLFSALAHVQPALAQVLGWQTFGPPLYQVNAIATVSNAEATVYAGASIYEVSQSAIFVSTDAGRTWRALVEAPRGDFYTEILVDAGDPRRIYAGALSNGSANIYRSIDGGETWSLAWTVSSSCSPSLGLGAQPDTVLLSCGTRFLRSRDAGASWAELSTPFTEPTRLASGMVGMLFGYGPTRIFRGSSDGDSWSAVASAPASCPGINVLHVDRVDPTLFIVGAGLLGPGGFQCGGVFKSSSAGATWTATGLSGVYVTDVVVDEQNASTVYASASYLAGILPKGGVYESADGGTTWRTLRLPALGALQLGLSPSGRFLHAATSIGVFDLGIRKTRVVAPRE
ncbi:MAG TPA: hypothetical protein VGL03_08870 [Thermoanaerobaculia bacterium]|jgi:photosystem II stability/assembly factor-like uncharacterized protein